MIIYLNDGIRQQLGISGLDPVGQQYSVTTDVLVQCLHFSPQEELYLRSNPVGDIQLVALDKPGYYQLQINGVPVPTSGAAPTAPAPADGISNAQSGNPNLLSDQHLQSLYAAYAALQQPAPGAAAAPGQYPTSFMNPYAGADLTTQTNYEQFMQQQQALSALSQFSQIYGQPPAVNDLYANNPMLQAALMGRMGVPAQPGAAGTRGGQPSMMTSTAATTLPSMNGAGGHSQMSATTDTGSSSIDTSSRSFQVPTRSQSATGSAAQDLANLNAATDENILANTATSSLPDTSAMSPTQVHAMGALHVDGGGQNAKRLHSPYKVDGKKANMKAPRIPKPTKKAKSSPDAATVTTPSLPNPNPQRSDSDDENSGDSDNDEQDQREQEQLAEDDIAEGGGTSEHKKALKKMYKQRYQQKKSIKRKLQRFHTSTGDSVMCIFVTKNSQRKFGCDIEYYNPSADPNCYFNKFWLEQQQLVYNYVQRTQLSSTPVIPITATATGAAGAAPALRTNSSAGNLMKMEPNSMSNNANLQQLLSSLQQPMSLPPQAGMQFGPNSLPSLAAIQQAMYSSGQFRQQPPQQQSPSYSLNQLHAGAQQTSSASAPPVIPSSSANGSTTN